MLRFSSFLCAVGALLAVGSAAPAQESPDPQGEHAVVVTVDDLPIAANRLHDGAERERITRALLDVFDRHHIKAVGLVVWKNVEPEDGTKLLGLWLARGHELGNHSFSHLDYSRTDSAAYIADVERGRAALAAWLEPHGRTVRWFRFPFLREGDTAPKLAAMRSALEASGQRNLPVTIDGEDWSFEEPWVLARRAADARRLERLTEDYQRSMQLELLSQTVQGDDLFGRATPQILLLHANEVGAAQWDELFTWMEGRGYRFANIDEVMADSALAASPAFVGAYGGGLWGRIDHERATRKAGEQVEALLAEQAASWNRGDLDAFCSVYADDAVFASPSGVSSTRQAALERYRKRYPDRTAMGTLALEPVDVREAWTNEVTMLGDAQPGRVAAVTVVARWTIVREGQPDATGLTLLVFRRAAGGWRIVQDASF